MTATIILQAAPITVYCSTVKRLYTSRVYQLQVVNTHTWAWASCPYCDRHCRTNADPAYDPTQPQPHCQKLDDAGQPQPHLTEVKR